MKETTNTFGDFVQRFGLGDGSAADVGVERCGTTGTVRRCGWRTLRSCECVLRLRNWQNFIALTAT
ncbi:MAG: hypothetical protein K8963_07715 [Proteobacteria bacterium]|nr:hypothetical protein [Pseudomonadota bacterium]